jgi:hypothetical protein
MQNDKKVPENKDVCDKILKQVGKPEGFIMCRAMNVYDDRYRVNIYTKRFVEGIEGQTISQSYFCKYDGKLVNILN